MGEWDGESLNLNNIPCNRGDRYIQMEQSVTFSAVYKLDRQIYLKELN
jgi:hypothetical protein